MVEETEITITRTSSSGDRTSNMTTIKGQGLDIKQAVRRLIERQMITTETIGIASSENTLFIQHRGVLGFWGSSRQRKGL